jgi:hypothetical protein
MEQHDYTIRNKVIVTGTRHFEAYTILFEKKDAGGIYKLIKER